MPSYWPFQKLRLLGRFPLVTPYSLFDDPYSELMLLFPFFLNRPVCVGWQTHTGRLYKHLRSFLSQPSPRAWVRAIISTFGAEVPRNSLCASVTWVWEVKISLQPLSVFQQLLLSLSHSSSAFRRGSLPRSRRLE